VIRYLALGDSYTIGTGASSPDASFPARLGARLRQATGGEVEVVNPAVNGYTSDDLIAVELPLLSPRPDLVSVLIGANDVVQRRPLAQYDANLGRIHDAVLAAGVEPPAVLALSIPDWSVVPAATDYGRREEIKARIDECNAAARRRAEACGFHWVDLTAAAHREDAPDGWLAADGLHPGGAQYAAWAEQIWAEAGAGWAAAGAGR
jgi:lysophospholipase L1-like esterase